MRRTSWRALLTLVIAVRGDVRGDGGVRRPVTAAARQARRARARARRTASHRPPPAAKVPTAVGSRRRGGDRRPARHAGRDRHAAPRRQRRRRRGRGRRRARRDRAVLGRHRRRRLHGHPHAARAGHDDRQPRDGAGRDASRTRSSRTAPPLAFNDARFSGLSAGVPGTVAGWEQALERYGTHVAAARRCSPGIDVARKGFVVDQTFFDQTHADRRLLQRRPVDGRDLPRPRRHAARRRHRAAQPGHGARVRDDRALRRRAASTAGRSPRAMAEAAQHPPIAADANHVWRPGLMTERDLARYTRARARSRRGSATRASTCGAWARRRAAARPSARSLNILEGYRPARRRPRRRRCTATSRRRATRSPTAAVPRRPGLRRRAAALPAVRPVRGEAPRADHRDGRERRPSPRGDCGPAGAAGADGRRGPVDDAPDRRRRRRHGRLLHVHDRVDRRQRHRRARAGASCSTTS